MEEAGQMTPSERFTGTEETMAIAAEEQLRAELYAFLARLLIEAPTEETLKDLAALETDDGPLADAFTALGRVAGTITPRQADREFHNLFVGLGRGELLPYASYYLTGFLNEKPLARLRDDMQRLGIERAKERCEPEDNIAMLCEMMAGLITGRFGDAADLATQQAFFSTHLAPWGGHFFSDLEGAKNSVFYAPVGKIGRMFMDIEREAFRMEGAA